MDIIRELPGIIGLLVVLAAFFLESSGRLPEDKKAYNWLFLIGSLFLALYAVIINSAIFIVLNTAAILIAANQLRKSR